IKQPGWRMDDLVQLCNRIRESAQTQQLPPAPRGLSHVEATTLRGALLGVIAGAAVFHRTNATQMRTRPDEPLTQIPKGWARLVIDVRDCFRRCTEPVVAYGISQQLAHEALSAPELLKGTLG